MTKRLVVAFFLSLFLMISCSYHTFTTKDIDPSGKIAVIICETQSSNVHALLADSISERFEAGSKLIVVPQYKVKAVLVDYPIRIRGPFRILGLDYKVENSRLDLNTLSGIAQKLNVNYIYAIWIPQAIEDLSFGEKYRRIMYTLVVELIEFPSRRVIAYYQDRMIACASSDCNDIKESCDFYSDLVVKDIIDNTGIGK